jgi:hypothetical protein
MAILVCNGTSNDNIKLRGKRDDIGNGEGNGNGDRRLVKAIHYNSKRGCTKAIHNNRSCQQE